MSCAKLRLARVGGLQPPAGVVPVTRVTLTASLPGALALRNCSAPAALPGASMGNTDWCQTATASLVSGVFFFSSLASPGAFSKLNSALAGRGFCNMNADNFCSPCTAGEMLLPHCFRIQSPSQRQDPRMLSVSRGNRVLPARGLARGRNSARAESELGDREAAPTSPAEPQTGYTGSLL